SSATGAHRAMCEGSRGHLQRFDDCRDCFGRSTCGVGQKPEHIQWDISQGTRQAICRSEKQLPEAGAQGVQFDLASVVLLAERLRHRPVEQPVVPDLVMGWLDELEPADLAQSCQSSGVQPSCNELGSGPGVLAPVQQREGKLTEPDAIQGM